MVGRHHGWRARDMRRETHALQHVAPQIDAGGDLDEGDALVGQAEHGALGDVEHLLPAARGLVA